MPLNKSSSFNEELRRFHADLGISDDFLEQCSLPLCQEPDALVETEADFYGRPQRLIAPAQQAWQEMKQSAAERGVVIHLISAFRGYEYQYQLIKRKLAAGQDLAQILSINAAPGYSEHHSGRAIDVGTVNCPALEEEFEHTPAFAWLAENAVTFGFSMTYPRGNPFGISYEPWHWCFSENK